MSNGTTIKGGASRVEGGSANGTLIDGGSQIVKVQGHADGTTINKSGSQDVVQGSLATNTTINGGRQYVEQSTVETTTIKNGGEQRVYESRALDTTIEGGTQSLNSKSTAKILRSILVVRKLLITPAPRMLLKFIPVACLMLVVVRQQMLPSTMVQF
ncbi:AIDA repeat-containing protein [Escherichia coli]|nr:AIDA repeat-containing protein [Escherichia coli]